MSGADLFKVTKATGLGLIADLGRPVQQALGIPLGGSLDPLTLRMMNFALGNPLGAACLELSGNFRFECLGRSIVMVGPEGCRVSLDGQAVESGRLLHVEKGQILETSKPIQGLWTQIAVSGGILGPSWRQSRSTALFLGQDHALGKTVRTGQIIESGDQNPLPRFPVSNPRIQSANQLSRIRLPSYKLVSQGFVSVGAIRGPEWEPLSGTDSHNPSLRLTVGREGSRMGLRMTLPSLGTPLKKPEGSYSSYPGLIQWPGSETLLLLLSDAQVTGGYSRFGSVVSTDLWKLAYLEPGGTLELQWLSLAQARQQHARSRRHFKTFMAQVQ